MFRGFLNVFRYITFRTGGAMVTGALFVFLFGPWIIDHLRLRQGKGQPIRSDGPQSHLVTKIGTPTMGGLMILSGLVVSTLLWANHAQPLCLDRARGDAGLRLRRLLRRLSEGDQADAIAASPAASGLRSKAVIALAACYALARLGRDPFSTSLVIPFFKDVVLNFGWFFVMFGAFIIGRRRQRGQSDRRSRRPRHRARDDRGGKLRHDRVSHRQRGVLGLPADQLRRRHRRTRGAVRRGAGRGTGIPVVQRAAGIDLHGRHRLAGAWRHARLDRGRGQARDRARR